MSPDDKEKLRVEYLRDNVEHYRKLETWGSSLFLGALGLVGRQLIEWNCSVVNSKHVCSNVDSLAYLPAIIGLVAFVFLRVVNYRGRKDRQELRGLIYGEQENGWPGLLGWLLALMPLGLGFFVSWYLAGGWEAIVPLCLVALGVILLAFLVHPRCCEWRNRSDRPDDA